MTVHEEVLERTLFADLDYDLLAEARRVLYAAAVRPALTADQGRCVEALLAADLALANALITLKCFGDEPGATQALEVHPSERERKAA